MEGYLRTETHNYHYLGLYITEFTLAVQNAITDGTSPSTFSLNNTCTRGQVVTFLWRDLA